MHTLHKFEYNGKTYKFVEDEDHETLGSYSYDTPEETRRAELEEIHKLNSGEWTVLGCIVEEPCPGATVAGMQSDGHCPCCIGHHEVDSLWGIVIENSTTAWEQYVKDGGI
jgi:hypothetical protein